MLAFEIKTGPIIKLQHDLFGPGESAARWLFLKTILFIYVLVVGLITGAFEHKSLDDYGLPLRKIFGKDFWSGALWGFGILTANIALESRHTAEFQKRDPGGMQLRERPPAKAPH
jgi:hypothetical protein